MKITILIADDHRLIREMWTEILNDDNRFLVVAQASNGEEAVYLTKATAPQIVLMDINMPVMNGIEATHEIRKQPIDTRIIGVSMNNAPAYAKRMIQSGASGYVTKNSAKEELMHAIEEVQAGRRYICEEVKDILADQDFNEKNQKFSLYDLTRQENIIIQLVKKGHSSREISTALQISLKTVEVHRYNILKKLGLKNTAALVNLANMNAL